jgi:hypothetical protein
MKLTNINSILIAQEPFVIDQEYKFIQFLKKQGELDLIVNIRQKRFESKLDSSSLPLIQSFYEAKQYKELCIFIDKTEAVNSHIDVQKFKFYMQSQLRENRTLLDFKFKTDDSTLLFFKAGNFFLSQRFKDAKMLLDSSKVACPSCEVYTGILSKSLLIKKKSPAVATLLSAVIPGAGKLYIKRYKDGITSFVLIVTMGLQSWYGFHHKGMDSYYGWINGALAVGFYGGNIWGTMKAVKQYNQVEIKKIADESREIMLAY